MSDSLYATIAQGVNPLTQAAGAVNVMRGMQDLRTQQFNLQQAKLQPAYAGLNALLEDPNPTWDKVSRSLANSERLGADTSALSDAANDMMANNGTPGDFIRQYGTARYVPPFEAAGLFLPKPGAMQTAAGAYTGTFGAPGSRAPGVFTPSGFVEKGLSPTEQMQGYTITGPDGLPINVPAGDVYGGGGAPVVSTPLAGDAKAAVMNNIKLRESGNRDVMNAQGSGAGGYYQIMPKTWALGKQLAGIAADQFPQAQGSPPDVQDKVASALYDRFGETPWTASAGAAGRYPGYDAVLQGRQQGAQPPSQAPYRVASAAPTAPPAGADAAPGLTYLPAAPGRGGVLPPGYTLPPPGAPETWKASVDMFNTARANYANQAQRVSPLQQSLNTLRANPNLATGPASEDVQNLEGIARVFGWDLGNNTVGNLNAYAEINKNLNRYYRSLPGASRSDMAELDAKLANPNTQMQREALDDLLARTVGVERMNDAAFLNFQQQHGAANASRYATSYADQASDYASKLDPVGFAFDQMSPQERLAYRNSLTTPEERTRYYNSIKEASRLYNLPIQ